MATSGSATSVIGGVVADAAHGDQDRALVALLVDGHRRHELGQVGDVLDLVAVEGALAERADGDRRVLQVGLALGGGDRDLFELGGVGRSRRGAVCAWTAVAAIRPPRPRNRPIGFCGASSSSLSLRAIFCGRDLRVVNSYSTTTLSISYLFTI
jgi:hypothetical protein